MFSQQPEPSSRPHSSAVVVIYELRIQDFTEAGLKLRPWNKTVCKPTVAPAWWCSAVQVCLCGQKLLPERGGGLWKVDIFPSVFCTCVCVCCVCVFVSTNTHAPCSIKEWVVDCAPSLVTLGTACAYSPSVWISKGSASPQTKPPLFCTQGWAYSVRFKLNV